MCPEKVKNASKQIIYQIIKQPTKSGRYSLNSNHEMLKSWKFDEILRNCLSRQGVHTELLSCVTFRCLSIGICETQGGYFV